MLGERLFPLIQRMFPDLAGKITGMLLEIDNAELVHMLEDPSSLKGKVRHSLVQFSSNYCGWWWDGWKLTLKTCDMFNLNPL